MSEDQMASKETIKYKKYHNSMFKRNCFLNKNLVNLGSSFIKSQKKTTIKVEIKI